MSILVVIVVLGIVIFVHELGHFVAAKAVGVQVLRFSIGFGPPILSWRRGETEYWLAWIPLGGYVKMAGLEEEGDPTARLEGGPAAVPIDPSRTLESKPVWARLIVMLAGVTMNVVLAFVISAGVNAVGAPQLAMIPVDSVTVDSLPPGTADLAGLRRGDLVERINGDTLRTLDDLRRWIVQGPDTLRLDIAGRSERLVVGLPRGAAERSRAFDAIDFSIPPILSFVPPGEPAHRAGLRPGDMILRVNGDTVPSWGELVRIITGSGGDSLRLDVQRGDTSLQVTVVPTFRAVRELGETAPRWLIGANANPPVVHVSLPIGQAIVSAFLNTAERTATVVVFLGKLVTGQVSMREVGGPVLIAQLSGQAARLGIVTFMTFLAWISLNLAVLNLLPIPVLDGGHVMFLLAEAIRGRPVSLAVRMRLTQVGFVVLIGLMILALSNDVLRNVGR